MLSLGKQQFQIFPLQISYKTVIRADDGVGQIAFGLLQLEDLLLDRIARNQAIGENLLRLPIRWARSIAWLSAAGFHHGSNKKT